MNGLWTSRFPGDRGVVSQSSITNKNTEQIFEFLFFRQRGVCLSLLDFINTLIIDRRCSAESLFHLFPINGCKAFNFFSKPKLTFGFLVRPNSNHVPPSGQELLQCKNSIQRFVASQRGSFLTHQGVNKGRSLIAFKR